MVSLWSHDDGSAELITRLDPKFKPVWSERPRHEQIALARYFLPHKSNKERIGPTRPRIVKWYCPFACQNVFPSGHRYSINIYTGCAHRCVYCYATAYEPVQCSVKSDFKKLIDRDMYDLEEYDVPPAPVHLSNSTDAFQPLEKENGHTHYALEQILAHRHRFTTVTVLTKNPLLAADPNYLVMLKALRDLPANHKRYSAFAQQRRVGLVVEISFAFWRDEARSFYEPNAPSVEQRIEGLRALHSAGIPLRLRIDPLFPRSPLPILDHENLADFGLPEAQSLDDLQQLLGLAKQIEVRQLVFSVAKIVRPRHGNVSPVMQAMHSVYAACAAPGALTYRSGSWRFPPNLGETFIVRPFTRLCDSAGLHVQHCMDNLLQTP